MEAMLNHPVLEKDELSFPTAYDPDDVVRYGLEVLYKMIGDSTRGHKDARTRPTAPHQVKPHGRAHQWVLIRRGPRRTLQTVEEGSR